MLTIAQLACGYNLAIRMDHEDGLFIQHNRVGDSNPTESTDMDKTILDQIGVALSYRTSLLSRLYKNATLFAQVHPTKGFTFEALALGKGIHADQETSVEYIKQVEGALIYQFSESDLNFHKVVDFYEDIPKAPKFEFEDKIISDTYYQCE